MKAKKCKDCKQEFKPFKFAQPRCMDCAIKKGREDAGKKAIKAIKERQREFKAETKRRREALKGKSEYKKEAQASFNAYIRQRDKHLGCISCGKNPNDNDLMTGSRWDAGHYRSRGANPELAFCELNCHKQCVHCNRSLSGNVANYRINLEKKIGKDKLEWLEGPHELKKLTIDDYKAIKVKYKNKIKDLHE